MESILSRDNVDNAGDDRVQLSASAPPSSCLAAPSREPLAIAALALAAFALNLNTSVLGALLPFLPPQFASHAIELLAAAGFGSALGALLLPAFTRRVGRRQALLGGLLVFVGVSMLHLVASSVWLLLSLRALSGIAVGVAYAAASALATEIVPYARRGAAMGWFTAGMFLAIPVGMPLSVLLARAGHWQLIFAVQAAIAAMGWWWAQRALPQTATSDPHVPYRVVLRNGPVLAGLLATALHVGSFFTTVQLATKWLHDTGLVPRDAQMWLWVGLGLASVAGSALLGRLSDMFGKRNFVLTTSAVLVGCFLLLIQEPGPLPMLAIGGLLAVAAAARTGPLQALVSGAVPREQLTTLMAMRGCAMQVGVGTFAMAAAPLADRLGFHGVLFLAAACQAASYVAIRLWVREGK